MNFSGQKILFGKIVDFFVFQSILAGNILEELQGVGATIFADYLVKANLSDLLTNDDNEFTLFAPTNEAFDQLEKSGKKILRKYFLFLKKHIFFISHFKFRFRSNIC